MKIYFLSSRPCALTLNEVFFGITDSFERSAEVCLSDRIFAKFTPEGALPVGFFITEELLSSPPPGCEVYLLKDGVAVLAKDFPPADLTLHPIAQARFGDSLVSVYRQGAVQLSLQTSEGFFVSSLPPSFSSCTLSCHAELFFVEGENHLAVYTKRGECLLSEQVLSFEVNENELNAYLPLSDSLGRVAECTWVLHENGCTRTKFVLRQSRALNGENEPQRIREELLPYAFFESVLIGADYVGFLSEELAAKASLLVDFLGDFKAVTLTRDPNVCGLVREKAPRLFEVAYYAVKTENGKIADITSS